MSMAEIANKAEAAAFMRANDKSPVVAGSAHGAAGGGTYQLKNGKRFNLTLAAVRLLRPGYPRWDLPTAKPAAKASRKGQAAKAMLHLDRAAWWHSTLILFGNIKTQMEGGNIKGEAAQKAASQIIRICDRMTALSLDMFDAEAAAAIARAEADALKEAAR